MAGTAATVLASPLLRRDIASAAAAEPGFTLASNGLQFKV
jgi:hypothetical protein